MAADSGLVFDIQSFSLHDGPGSRTLVFLSGCPLRCEWCCNPEGLELRQRVLFCESKCRYSKGNCRRCLTACPSEAISIDPAGGLKFDLAICQRCQTRTCVERCIYEAIKLAGRWMTADDVMTAIHRDSPFWSRGGGVTFSGGEALTQGAFLVELLQRCKRSAIHRAIETTAYADPRHFLNVMQHVDQAMIDVKHMDPRQHQLKTGVGNEIILNNIRNLANSSWKGRIVLRMPIIEGFNDTEENLRQTAAFMHANGLVELNVLSFHRMGESKWTQLGKRYTYSDAPPTSREHMEQIQDLFLDQGIACYVDEELT